MARDFWEIVFQLLGGAYCTASTCRGRIPTFNRSTRRRRPSNPAHCADQLFCFCSRCDYVTDIPHTSLYAALCTEMWFAAGALLVTVLPQYSAVSSACYCTASHVSAYTVVRAIRQLNGGGSFSTPWRLRNPWTDSAEIWHVWLCTQSDSTCKIRWPPRRVGWGGRWHKGSQCVLSNVLAKVI